jgi:hypothetical protein
VKSETHKIIPFVCNKKYVRIPREQMIQSVTDNMNNLLEPTTWPTAVLSPWQNGEEKLK